MYVSDSLLLIQRSLGVDQKNRYIDFVMPPKESDEVSGEEIISNIKEKVRGY